MARCGGVVFLVLALLGGPLAIGESAESDPATVTVELPGILDLATAERIAVAGGFAEVTPEAVAVTARAAESADEIDVSRAEDSKRRAEQRLRHNQEDVDAARADASLARAMNRLRIAQGGQTP